MIGIDLPFVHGFPVVTTGSFATEDLQALLHKSGATTFGGAVAAAVAAVTRLFIAATRKSKWTRTGFGLGG
jgi:hypothetical protein